MSINDGKNRIMSFFFKYVKVIIQKGPSLCHLVRKVDLKGLKNKKEGQV